MQFTQVHWQILQRQKNWGIISDNSQSPQKRSTEDIYVVVNRNCIIIIIIKY